MKKFRRSIIFAALLYIVDAGIYSQGGITLIAVLIIILVLVPKILIAFFRKNKGLFKERMITAGIYLLVLVIVFASNGLNNRLAFKRAKRIIQASNEYKAKYAGYPDKLQDLVPEFIAKVPLAKLALAYNKFIYIAREEQHLLVYYALPPFGKRIYYFEEGQWGYLD
ncbi:MAG: hypothetical protein ABIC18_03085 [Candidatus Omnitrophota bacterium]